MEFNSYYLGQPKYTADECIDRGVTFSAPLRVKLSLHITDENNKNEYAQSIEQDVYFGNIPYMTEKGTFIINGAERVIVSQLQRSPAYFSMSQLIQMVQSYIRQGSFLLEVNGLTLLLISRLLVCYHRQKEEISVTMLLRALGYSSNSDICKAFGSLISLKLKDKKLKAT